MLDNRHIISLDIYRTLLLSFIFIFMLPSLSHWYYLLAAFKLLHANITISATPSHQEQHYSMTALLITFISFAKPHYHQLSVTVSMLRHNSLTRYHAIAQIRDSHSHFGIQNCTRAQLSLHV